MPQTDNILKFEPLEIKADIPKTDFNHILLGIVPFTPVQFSGSDALLAWGRLIGFSAIAYLTFNKMRPLSYAAMGAAGVSLATSLTAKLWGKK